MELGPNILEQGAYRLALSLYVVSSAGYILGLILGRTKLVTWSGRIAGLGLVPHTLAIVIRWVELGHGPFLRRYEAFSSYAWAIVLVFLVVSWRYGRLRAAGGIVMPVAAAVAGAGALSPIQGEYLSPAMNSYWLGVHVAFAKITLAAMLIAAGVAALQLLSLRRLVWTTAGGAFGPEGPAAFLEEATGRLTGVAFVAMAITIAAGALWAETAWGRYWSWDPIESWSMATWLTYGLVLHLRRSPQWCGSRGAWLTVLAAVLSCVTFLGLSSFAGGPHTSYTAP